MTLNPLLFNASALTTHPTGISTYIKNLAPHFEATKSILVTPEKFLGQNCYLIPQGLSPAFGLKGHLRRLLWLQFRLPKIFKDTDAALIFSPLLEAPIHTAGCRFIVTAHDIIPLRFPRNLSPLTNYFRYYVPSILKQAEHIICDSLSTARDLKDFYQVSARKTTVIPLAYDANNFRPQVAKRTGENYFLYLGRQDPYKNIERLISAYYRITQSEGIELWLAGPQDARYTPRLQAYIKELGIEGRVKFLSYVPYQKLPELLSNALALVFPTLWEGFGLPALEAMACGTPVITSAISSLPEVVGDSALLVNPYSVDEIADAMKMLARDTALRNELSQSGLARAKQFSWAKTGRQTVEVLDDFI